MARPGEEHVFEFIPLDEAHSVNVKGREQARQLGKSQTRPADGCEVVGHAGYK